MNSAPRSLSAENTDHTLPLKINLCWAIYDIAWKRKRNGEFEPRKIPVDPKTGNNLHTNAPEEWTCTYSEAVAAFEGGQGDGVGFLTTRQDIVHVSDMDDAWDAKRNCWNEAALDTLKEQNTYAEISQSGTGIHTIGWGSKPKGQRKKFSLNGQSIESYDGSWHSNGTEGCPRFITFTGKPIPGYDKPIKDVQSWIDDNVPMKAPEIKQPHKEPSVNSRSIDSSDKEILKVLENMERGERFGKLYYDGDSTLWEGVNSSYDSQSEADLSLAGMLAWATGRDKERMDLFFRSSALMRGKWDENRGDVTYGDLTLNTAIANCHSTLSCKDHKERDKFIMECHHFRMNNEWKNMDKCHLYGAFYSMGSLYGDYVAGKGVYVEAPVRNLNLRSRVVKTDARDHAKVSKVRKELQEEDGSVEEVEKGGPMGTRRTSKYRLPKPPSTPLPQFLLHRETHPLFSYVGVFEGVVEIEDLNWLQMLTWTSGVNKKQRFIIEQIFYGRNTLELLEEFFDIRRDNLKRSLKPLFSKKILTEEAGILCISEENIKREFIESGGHTELKTYLNKIGSEREQYKEKGIAANNDRSYGKIKAYLAGDLRFKELTSFEKNLLEKHEELMKEIEMRKISDGETKAAAYAKEQGYYHPELNPDGEVA